MEDKFYEKTIATKRIFSGRIIDVQVDEVELPNGEKSIRELVKHPGAVAIIAVTAEERIVFVRQYRKALNKSIIEIPAGKLEHGEEPLTCAIRELEEETGYKSKQMRFVVSFYTSPGFADELIHIFYTDELEKGVVNMDEDEFVETVELTVAEALKLVESEEIHDAKTIFALQYLQLKGLST